MAVDYIRRGAGLAPSQAQKAGKASPIYVDSTTDTLNFGVGASGTSTKQAADLTSTQTLTNKTLTSPTINTPTITTPTVTGATLDTLKSNVSTTTVSAGYAADTNLAGSNIAMPTGGPVVNSRYLCTFDMVKTAAGTAAFTITVRYGTTGTTSDAAILTFAFGAGTAAADTGTFEVFVHFRSVGAVTAAVLAGTAYCGHALAATGLISTGAAGQGQVTAVSSGFDSTPAGSILSISVNGGASFSGTNTLVETEFHGF